MPPTKPKPNPQKKPEKKIKILQVKRIEQKFVWSEHFYPILGILFVVIIFFLGAFGMRWDESGVVGLWIVGIIFVGRQVVLYFKGGPTPKKGEKKPLASMPPKKYTPPALPRVSKDFRPMPPEGDKRYPPPSPFIKPPSKN
jgi:hypothetical protein